MASRGLENSRHFTRFSRHFSQIDPDTPRQQEAQIVQSQLDLDDFLQVRVLAGTLAVPAPVVSWLNQPPRPQPRGGDAPLLLAWANGGRAGFVNSFTRWWEVTRREFRAGQRQPVFWLLPALLGT